MSQNKGKVYFGLKKAHIAFLDNSGAAPVWDNPIEVEGLVSFAPEPQGGESTFYADDGPYFVYNNNNGYTGELVIASVPDDILAQMLGLETDVNGMITETTSGTPREFALMFEVSGNINNKRYIYYRCKAARPGKEHTTKGDSVEPSTDSLSLTILPIEVNGKNIVKSWLEKSDTNAAVYNNFFNAVTLPGAEPVAADKTALAAAIALGDTLDELDYTVDSWGVFSAALAAAVIVNEDVDATQSEVNSARKALTEAILALVPAAG